KLATKSDHRELIESRWPSRERPRSSTAWSGHEAAFHASSRSSRHEGTARRGSGRESPGRWSWRRAPTSHRGTDRRAREPPPRGVLARGREIGRASCRERVWLKGDAGSGKDE